MRREGVWVNRPAVDTTVIAPRPPRHAGPIKLLATGRLVWKKGFDYLLAAIATLVRRGVDLRAEIVGDGELRSLLRFSIHDLGIAAHVTLAGPLRSDEVLAKMQDTDVFVLSSHEEGISNAALEAMASGVPIVTTNAGGMAEAVNDGVEGFVVSVRDVTALADRIECLARDAALRARMGQAARIRAERDFALARQLDTFEALYRSVCA
jgi:glycosyltransferase involved in cell wall biosynthesis